MAEEAQRDRVEPTMQVRPTQLPESTQGKDENTGVSGRQQDNLQVAGVKKVSFGTPTKASAKATSQAQFAIETTGRRA